MGELLPSKSGEHPKRPRRKRTTQLQTFSLAGDQQKPTEEARTADESSTLAHPLFHVYVQVSKEGNFGQEQKEDERIEHCWGQVCLVKGKDQSPGQALSPTYSLIHKGCLYDHVKRCIQPTDLLMVPHSKVDIVMHLVHTHPLGGHLAVRNTVLKLHDKLYWPGMEVEVKNLCQCSSRCQCPAPQ